MRLSDYVERIIARQILNSRGDPAVEIEFRMKNCVKIISSCPAGASTGSREALVLLDGQASYSGKSAEKIIDAVRKNEKRILNECVETQKDFDEFISQISKEAFRNCVYSNFTLPLSMCFCRLNANIQNISLHTHISNIYGNTAAHFPVPHFNILNGGKHSGNNLHIQEIMISFGEINFAKSIEYASTVYSSLKEVISEKYGRIYTSVGDEGGFAPPIDTLDEALFLIRESFKRCSFNRTSLQVSLDCAANSFYVNGKYILKTEINSGESDNAENSKLDPDELIDYYNRTLERNPEIYSIEDPFAENDESSWLKFYEKCGDELNIVADDLTVTNPNIIKETKNMYNTVIIKPNQIGNVSSCLEAVREARSRGIKIMASHRSGETEDVFISHLAVGVGADSIKCGAPARGERISKYNELLRIYEEYR
ncbi:enolase [Enteropsectra breve]|nr:enolase [Enteropsectra breve]